MMKSYTKSVEESQEDITAKEEIKEEIKNEPRKQMNDVCSSVELDKFLQDPSAELKVSYSVPECESVKYVSDKTTGMDYNLEAQIQSYVPTGGLGLKRKKTAVETEKVEANGPQLKKAKTLAEKREFLHEDIMKYGVAAIEKLYPRQRFYQQPASSPVKKIVPKAAVKVSPIKMKPKPVGLDFEEIDARKILRPMSHAKYIKDPDYDYMVYINRKEGLVPLSSLCKEDAKTVLSSNVKLLKGRNVRLGKPRVFVKDEGRMVAIGGSRSKSGFGLKVIRPPKLVKILPLEKMLPFQIDSEYALFAASAIPDLKKMSKRVDIRVLKKMKRLQDFENRPLSEKLEDGSQSIVNHLYEKFNPLEEEGVDDDDDEELNKKGEELLIKSSENDSNKIENENQFHEKNSSSSVTEEENMDSTADGEDEKKVQAETDTDVDGNDSLNNDQIPIHNAWSDRTSAGKMPIDMTDDKPIVSEDFKKLMESKRLTNSLSGVDVCDVPECYCKNETLYSKSGTGSVTPIGESGTGSVTPIGESGSVTPKDSGKEKSNKTSKNLKKVKRALKTLGVNFLTFDDQENPRNGTSGNNGEEQCEKDHCRFGCICESINGSTKNIAPSHCGKEECMFSCTCSKDALKLTNTDAKTGICAEGLSRNSTFRNRLAQEELKFSNTVVASGLDLLMIGTSAGRTKRERKVPSRYQDTDAFFDSNTGMPATNAQKAAAVLMLEENTHILPATPGATSHGTPMTRRLTQDSLKHDKIKKCTVIMPMLPDLNEHVKIWCLYHNQYECPCHNYKNPLDYGPDINQSRNVARRSLGSNFKSKLFADDDEIYQKQNSKNTHFNSETNTNSTAKLNTTKQSPTKFSPESSGSDNTLLPTMCSKFNHDPREHCARTAGHDVRKFSSKATKYPHKIHMENNKKHPRNAQPSARSAGPSPPPLIPLEDDEEETANFGRITSVTSLKQVIRVKPKKPETITVDDFKDFKLVDKPKGSFMFVHWHILRHYLNTKKVKIYAVNKGRMILFVCMSNSLPYIHNASDIHDPRDPTMSSNFNGNPMFDTLKKIPNHLPDDATHLALTYNGLAWEISGLANKEKENASKHANSNEQQPSKVFYPSKEAAPMNKLNSSEILVKHEISVQRLPRGQNLVSVTRPGLSTIQVKLPLTEKNQYWCTIKVDGTEQSVQCPGTGLSLKVGVLKQAAGLANSEKTTVRIPIAASGEVANFGVYAVPGLQSHVFVGPFTTKTVAMDSSSSSSTSSSHDVITLDEEGEVPTTATDAQAPDDQTAQEQSIDQKSVSSSGIEIISMNKTPEGPKFNKIKVRQNAIMGQVPQKIINANNQAISGAEPDVVTADECLSDNEDRLVINEGQQVQKPEYINPPKNPYGKVVYNPNVDIPEYYINTSHEQLIHMQIPNHGSVKVFQGQSNVHKFMHPNLKYHEVFCKSLNDVKKWLEYFVKEEESKKSDDDIALVTPEIEASSSSSSTAGIKIKSMTSLMAKPKPPPKAMAPISDFSSASSPPLRPVVALPEESTAPVERVINGRRFVCHTVTHNGKKGVALVFDRRQHIDMRKLYHKLNQVLSSNGLRKVASSVQILTRAKDEILKLEKLDHEYTKLRKEMMLKRSELFKMFSENLNHLQSPADKKSAVLALKEGLKKIKESKPSPESVASAVRYDESVLVNPDPNSKLHPNTKEQLQPRAELQAIMPRPPMFGGAGSGRPRKEAGVMRNSPGKSSGGITPYSDITGLQTVRKDQKVLRPMNAFMIWSRSYRKELISKGMDGATVSKLLADKWKMMSDAEKSRWYTEQERMKNLHQLQHPNYKYNPKMRPKKLSMKQSVARIDPTLAPISIASVMSQAGPNIMSQTGAIISQGGPMMSPSGIILSQTTASTHTQYAPQQQQPPPDVVIPMPGPSNADNTTEEFCVSIPEDEHGQIAIHNISKNQDFVIPIVQENNPILPEIPMLKPIIPSAEDMSLLNTPPPIQTQEVECVELD